MSDRFAHHAQSLDGPAEHGFAITPSDSAQLSEVTRALYVGTGGTLVAVLRSGAELTLKNVPDGTLLPLRCRQIKQTATTAADCVGLV